MFPIFFSHLFSVGVIPNLGLSGDAPISTDLGPRLRDPRVLLVLRDLTLGGQPLPLSLLLRPLPTHTHTSLRFRNIRE